MVNNGGHRIGLDGIKDIAFEMRLKPFGGDSYRLAAHQGHGSFRRRLADQVQGRWVVNHRKTLIKRNPKRMKRFWEKLREKLK